MGRNNFLQSCRLGGVALGATLFICGLWVVDSRLSRVHALVGALLLAVELLLLRGRSCNVEIGAETLFLTAALSVNAIRACISKVGHSLLIL